MLVQIPQPEPSAHRSTKHVKMEEIHSHLSHPGTTRLFHFVRTMNLQFYTEDRKVCQNCRIYAENKPQFHQSQPMTLALHRLGCFNQIIDPKGPLPSKSRNLYILTYFDEYSRFPFAFPCQNITIPLLYNASVSCLS